MLLKPPKSPACSVSHGQRCNFSFLRSWALCRTDLGVGPSSDKKNGDYIETYKLGKKDEGGTTTARVVVTIPGKKSDFTGRFPWNEYYTVNGVASGYQDRFDNKPVRAFHGNDKNDAIDMMIYFPESVLGKNIKGLKALS